MPQSLVAVIAMALASMVSFQQHRSVLEQRMNAMRSILSVRATEVASDKLDEIGSAAFDAATVTAPISAAFLLSDLTINGSTFGTPDDINDYQGVTVTDKRVMNGSEAAFEVKTSVAYVSEVDGASEVASKTRLKKVTVTVVPLGIAQADTIRVAEIMACGDKCQW